MATEISIRYEGTTPGLGDGRLSLNAFLPALNELLIALRRIGSNIVVQAIEDTERGGKGGRVASDASVLDLEIGRIDHNCLVIEAVPTAHPRVGQNLKLFDDLPERSVDELLRAIEDESKGHPHNARVREYLASIPGTVSEHHYELRVNGNVKRKVTVTGVKPIDSMATLPWLREFMATPSGVVFDANPKLLLNEGSGSPKWYSAARAHVDAVLGNKDSSFRVLAVYTGSSPPRVLRLGIGDKQLPKFPDSAWKNRIFADWDGVLRRLA